VRDLELTALKILLHDEPTLGEVSKQNLIATIVYAVRHIFLAASPKTNALTTAEEVEEVSTDGVGAARCRFDHACEYLQLLLQDIQIILVTLVILNRWQLYQLLRLQVYVLI
jgi:hypothetical protein